jgi:hypothetical protein
MKKIIMIFTFIIGLSMSCFAQDDVEENLPNIIKVNPISLAFGNINLIYQRAIGKSSALQIGGNYWYRFLGTEVTGFGLRGGYQFFLTNRTKMAPEGFYLGPHLAYNSLKERETETQSSATTFGVGLMLGYQWVWKSGLSLDLGIGPMYTFAQENNTENSFEGFLPNIMIGLGYNF